MIDFMFFVKTFCLTILIVLLMQIEIGSNSVEQHALGFVQSSTITAPLNAIARGAAKMARDVTTTVSARIRRNTKKVEKEEAKASSSASPDYDGQD